ncbi:MAG: MAPEG family protein [Burkholderiales bacterium]|nr:MAPEG family protein [Burkholderiales bacterium]
MCAAYRVGCAGQNQRLGHSAQDGGYDNNNPEWEAKLTGWQQRANAAQANGFGALPLFIAGVPLAKWRRPIRACRPAGDGLAGHLRAAYGGPFGQPG